MSLDSSLGWQALGEPTLVSAHHTPAIEWALRHAPQEAKLILHFHTEARLCPEAPTLLAAAARRNATVVVPSATSLEQYAAVADDSGWFRNSAVVVPTLMTPDLQPTSASARSTQLPLATAGPRVGVVARVDDDKTDHDYLLETILALGELDATAQVVVAGFGEQLPHLREAVGELVAQVQTVILGHVEDIDAVYAWSEVLFLPSYTEVFPHSVLEGAARGLHTVVADFGFGAHGCESWLIQVPVGDAQRAALELVEAARRNREKQTSVAPDDGDLSAVQRDQLRELLLSSLCLGPATP
ncbi:MAG: glycosyltransferase [Acidimicrobiia bacterium]|nr:glycosyltransferase [Acidimicrobiia bacterium]